MVTCTILVLGLVACTVPAITPTATPEAPTVVVTRVVTPTPEPTPVVVTVIVIATDTPTPALPTPTDTPTPVPPTETPPPPPRATPTSAGPLGFPEPRGLDHWQFLPDGGVQCKIILHITGGVPPYTVHHDLDVFTTWETDPELVFRAEACDLIVHTIKVESADGQTFSDDYAITPPWCVTPGP
nr:hypothetical protein [Anaerolineae bacterium]